MGIEGKILCIGDLILDRYIHGDIERISPEAPIPILKIGKKDYNVLGGCGNVVETFALQKVNVIWSQ